MTSRELRAFINQMEIGTLKEVNGLWSFHYAQTWLDNPQNYPLSPTLPLTKLPLTDGASQRPVQWYFDNLLPEEGQRYLLAKDAKLDIADAFSLLTWYGAESAGSLTLLPSSSPQDFKPLSSLSFESLEHRIQRLPQAPLTQEAIKRMSLAGAQHKLAVVLQKNQIFEPQGASPSTHILKPDHPDKDYAQSVINEWFIGTLAIQLGLEVPPVYRLYVPSSVYLIKRFDREFKADYWQRLHSIDACQLLNLDRSFKYSEGNLETLLALAHQCRSSAVTRAHLFSWLVFNILVGNSDAHLKNISFMINHEGIKLAPFYDLLSVAVYDAPSYDKHNWPSKTQLAWPLLGRHRFHDVDRNLLMQVGNTLNLSTSTSTRLLNVILYRIADMAQAIYKEMIKKNEEMCKNQPKLAHTFTAEARCIRAIIYGVIQPMVEQLKA